MQPITTARLVIRPFAPTDLDDFLAYQSDPEVRRHLPGEPLAPDEAALYLAKQAGLDDEVRDAWHDWAIEHAADGRVVGNIGVFLPGGDLATADLGFQLHPAYQGQGLASEAARALLVHLVDGLGLTRVTGSCDTGNDRSARLLLGLGMTEVAGAREGSRTFELRR